MTAIYGPEGITPGRVLSLDYGDNQTLRPDGERLVYGWLYVVFVAGGTAYGLAFGNSAVDYRLEHGEPARLQPFWHSVVLANVPSNSVTHNVDAVGWWPETLGAFLATPGTFPDVTPFPAAPPPPAVADGDMIPRAVVVRRLERASEVASAYADENSLCGEFERCMDAIGLQDLGLRSLRERERLFRVQYTRETTGTCETCGHEVDDTDTDTHDVWITSGSGEDAAFDVLVEMLDASPGILPGWDGDTSDLELERL